MKKILSYILLFFFAFGVANTQLPMDVLTDVDPIKVEATKENRVMLYPNPATTFTQIKITAKDTQISEVAVYSLLGNQLFSKSYDGEDNTIQLNVQNYKKGKYLVKVVFTDGTTEVKALVKQ